MKEKTAYICKSEDGRALYYATSVGRRRVYRQQFGMQAKGLKILDYHKFGNALAVCETINAVYNDNFKPTPLQP